MNTEIPETPRRKKRSEVRRAYVDYRLSMSDKVSAPRIPKKAAVPSLFTLLNLLCGFVSLVESSRGRFERAGVYIFLAGFFDVLDGLMARITNGDSEFGVQLDSLSDIVSFGVAPAFLLYQVGLKDFELMGLLVASLPMICGSVRLARFNVSFEGEKHSYFEGLPIPAAGILLVSLVLTSLQYPEWFDYFVWGKLSVIVPFIIFLSALMVSEVQFDAIPNLNPSALKKRLGMVLFFSLGALLSLIFHAPGILISLLGYLVFSLGRALYRFAVVVMAAE